MTSLRKVVAAALLTGAVVQGCMCYPEPEKIVQPPAAIPAVPTKVSGVFMDAKSEALVTKQIDVTVRTPDGKLATGIKSPDGKTGAIFTVTNGVLAFQVADASFPLKLTVVAMAEGYNATSARLEFPTKGDQNFSVKMVQLSAPPASVAVVEKSVGSADATGTLPLAATVDTPATTETHGGATEVVIPANTTVTTADGTPLTGQLTASVSYFNNIEPDSLSAFPGGLEVNVPPTAGAAREEGVFISAGFTAIEIKDSNGNVASKFSQPVPVSMVIPAGTINPDTGVAIAAGDTVPFWSYNETTGVWGYEAELTVADVNGELVASGTTTHLSYFNLDWFYGQDAICNPGSGARKIVLTGNAQNLPVQLELTNGSGYYKSYPTYAPDVNSVQLLNAPRAKPMNIKVKFQGNYVSDQGGVDVADLCTGGDISVPVTMPNVQPATLSVTFERVCEQDEAQKTGVPASVVAYAPGVSTIWGATNASGVAELSGLISGQKYFVYAFPFTVNGTTQMVEVTPSAGANSQSFTQTVECGVVSGSTGG